MLRQSSETLAGRVRFVEIGGLSSAEVGPARFKRLWARGGFPRSFLAKSDSDSFGWREDFIRTFVERDVGLLGITLKSSAHLRRLWSMLAHRHAQLSALADESRKEGRPLSQGLHSRFRLLHALLGVRTLSELQGHPKLGASWEGFVLEAVIRRIGDRDVYFWATHSGAELDIVVQRGRAPYGIEVKWSDAPRLTKSMQIALIDLGLRRLFVVYPGPKRYSLQKNVEAIPIGELDTILD